MWNWKSPWAKSEEKGMFSQATFISSRSFLENHTDSRQNTLFFFYENIFYKNIEAQICEILRIF